MVTLNLVLKHKWYDMIQSGEKTEEYRDIKKWEKRISQKQYTHVRFHRGYTTTVQLFELEEITTGFGRKEWGAPDEEVIIIKLGKRCL